MSLPWPSISKKMEHLCRSLALKNVLSFLRSIANQGDNLANLVDVIVTIMVLAQKLSLLNTHSSSEIINAIQRDLVILVNQIVVYSSNDVVKAAASQIASVITLAVTDERMFKQFF